MRRPVTTLLSIFTVLSLLGRAVLARAEEDGEEEDVYGGEGDAAAAEESYDGGDDADYGSGPRTPSSVFVMEHGFLTSEGASWTPRGTLLLSGAERGFEARLSDAKEFVQLRPELQQLMSQAASKSRYYAIRMYSPESPKRVLQASIPAKLLADHFEDWHDILEVTVGATGVPVGLSYRVKHTLGLALFDHTQVHLAEPSRSEGPRVAPSTRDATGAPLPGKAGEQPQQQSFLRKYWWVIIIVLLLLSSAGDDGSAGKGGGGGGGGGGRGGGGGK